ncbi:prohibitin family protein [Permianibacter aggregans]|uniref:Regulator of protease activity HflC (Stomatin/prohibitin superfamily) n=1 Tax=Permianibacter aggregans TaxID=1510150 RepID=A0A4R6V0K3_9GAMM|nr:prohibitin family protein [Permianibacter aggregans]QGX40350.1 prohibitin family protein [Permianibacter aggregans]TDQ49524.1 regulator of protease activity HflC (stomatin/prohibitin superfamily) [Permianibacter aggregans]
MIKIISKLLFAALVVAGVLMFGGCAEIIDAGHRGVKVRFGEVEQETLKEGFYWYNPLTTTIVEIDTRIKSWKENTQAYTKDVQQADINFTINFRLAGDSVHLTYQEVGKDWDDKLLPQVVFGTIKEVIGKQTAEALITNRSVAQEEVLRELKEAMEKHRIVLINFEFNDISYTDAFERAIEAKVIATQRAIEEENRTRQIEEQAKQKVIAAKAEAESIQIRAAALEQNPRLVELEAVQKWDGKLPQITGSAVPFISLPETGEKNKR